MIPTYSGCWKTDNKYTYAHNLQWNCQFSSRMQESAVLKKWERKDEGPDCQFLDGRNCKSFGIMSNQT